MKQRLHRFLKKYSFTRWLFLTKEGYVVIIQWPNAPLILAALAKVGSLIAPGANNRFGQGLPWLLLAWASLEMVSGVNPFRRILGIIVGILAVLAIFR